LAVHSTIEEANKSLGKLLKCSRLTKNQSKSKGIPRQL
jgi:hypothetical protein